jgi:fatty acid desaturase
MLLAIVLLPGTFVMSNSTATEAERTLGTIIKDLTADLSMLFRSEIALLKLELKDAASKLGSGAALIAGALFLALIGLAFLFVTITLGMIALGAPPWLSSLIVTVVLFAAAAVLVVLGKKKLKDVDFVPNESIEHIKTDIDAIKADVARMRSH